MPPKRGQKRKVTPKNGGYATNRASEDAPLVPPDRSTWPGWVEMESEPVSDQADFVVLSFVGANTQAGILQRHAERNGCSRRQDSRSVWSG